VCGCVGVCRCEDRWTRVSKAADQPTPRAPPVTSPPNQPPTSTHTPANAAFENNQPPAPQLGDPQGRVRPRRRLPRLPRIQPPPAPLPRLAADHHPDLAAGVGGYGGVCVLDAAALKHAAAHGGERLDDVQVEPEGLRLGADDAAGAHGAVHCAEEGLCLFEGMGGAFGGAL